MNYLDNIPALVRGEPPRENTPFVDVGDETMADAGEPLRLQRFDARYLDMPTSR